jgi:hypothetical protein
MAIHTIWHKFSKKFIKSNELFKSEGYKLMVAAEKFAKENPTCWLASCDDNTSCSSSILFIPHESKEEYWGTTVVIIPQYGKPLVIFLYEHDAQSCFKAIQSILKKHKQMAPVKRRADAKRNRQQKSVGFQLKPKDKLIPQSLLNRWHEQAEQAWKKKYPVDPLREKLDEIDNRIKDPFGSFMEDLRKAKTTEDRHDLIECMSKYKEGRALILKAIGDETRTREARK